MRIVIEEDQCEHGLSTEHLLAPPNMALVCDGPSRTVLNDRSEALRVLFPDGPTDEMVEAAKEVIDSFLRVVTSNRFLVSEDLVEAALDAALGLTDRTTSEYESNAGRKPMTGMDSEEI